MVRAAKNALTTLIAETCVVIQLMISLVLHFFNLEIYTRLDLFHEIFVFYVIL